MSTRQNPQARVQRSPLIMNVAVPSDQHSDRFGQPASSHTVTRSRSRIVLRMAMTSSVSCSLARIHSGLRLLMSRPSVTPASASRPARRAVVPLSVTGTGADVGRTVVPGPSPRLNGDRSSGVWRHTTSARSWPALPHRSAARRATASTTSRIDTSTPSSRSEVTPLSAMPHGTMWPNIAMSGADVQGEAVHRPTAGELDPDRADLPGPVGLRRHPHAGEPGHAPDVGRVRGRPARP